MKIQRRKKLASFPPCSLKQKQVFCSLLCILAVLAYSTTVWAPMVARENAWAGLRNIQRKKWISNSAQPFVRFRSIILFSLLVLRNLSHSHSDSFLTIDAECKRTRECCQESHYSRWSFRNDIGTLGRCQ